jgi:hypothetical protein
VGTHTLTLTVTDDDGAPDDDTVVVVVSPSGSNHPPLVDAGPNQIVTLAAGAVLTGSVTDDGSYAVMWTKVSAPRNALVTFADPYAEETTVTFSMAGVYVLRLTANDGVNPPISANVTITVQ